MDAEAAAAALGKTELLVGLEPDDLVAVASITRERLDIAGVHVFHQGEPADAWCVVASGSVGIYLSRDAIEITIGLVGSNQSFGEMAVLDGGPRATSARTLEPSTLLEIPRGAWLELLGARPTVAKCVLEALGGIVRRYAGYAADCLFLDVEGRVAQLLLQLAERAGGSGQRMRLDLRITQREIARMVGASRQSVNLVLRTLEALSYVESDSGELVIVDRDGLEALGSFSGHRRANRPSD